MDAADEELASDGVAVDSVGDEQFEVLQAVGLNNDDFAGFGFGRKR